MGGGCKGNVDFSEARWVGVVVLCVVVVVVGFVVVTVVGTGVVENAFCSSR